MPADSRYRDLAARGAVAASLVLVFPSPVAAGPLTFLAKAATLGSKAAKGAKVAKGAQAIKLVGAAGAALAAERAATLFAHTGDDLGRAAAYVARETGGEFHLIVKNASQDIKTTNVNTSLAELSHENVDLYVDLSAARDPRSLPQPKGDGRLFALDADAKPHPVRIEKNQDGIAQYVVDYAGDSVDLASFVHDQVSEESDDLEPPLAFLVGTTVIGGLGVLGWFWVRRRKRRQQRVENATLG